MEQSGAKIRRTRLVARTARRLRAERAQDIAVDAVVSAFGGKRVDVQAGSVADPVTLLAIRDLLQERLHSTGGRPTLIGKGQHQRIQVLASDWAKVRDISDRLRIGQHRAAPSQVLSALIHLALERIPPEEIDTLAGAAE